MRCDLVRASPFRRAATKDPRGGPHGADHGMRFLNRHPEGPPERLLLTFSVFSHPSLERENHDFGQPVALPLRFLGVGHPAAEGGLFQCRAQKSSSVVLSRRAGTATERSARRGFGFGAQRRPSRRLAAEVGSRPAPPGRGRVVERHVRPTNVVLLEIGSEPASGRQPVPVVVEVHVLGFTLRHSRSMYRLSRHRPRPSMLTSVPGDSTASMKPGLVNWEP